MGSSLYTCQEQTTSQHWNTGTREALSYAMLMRVLGQIFLRRDPVEVNGKTLGQWHTDLVCWYPSAGSTFLPMH